MTAAQWWTVGAVVALLGALVVAKFWGDDSWFWGNDE